MVIIKQANDVSSQIQNIRNINPSIGFVPTMGALHEGHVSLLKESKQTCNATVCSIFINPTQFNNSADFKKYPVTLEQDIYTLEKNGCDILFVPAINEMYPNGTAPEKHFDLGHLENILEGKFRPGHFQGVCQVVKRLLEIVEPSHLFVGQKDYQQCMVIKRLLKLENLKIELVISPTLREESGLAMSSRNLRLTEQQRENAAEIYKTLLSLQQNIKPGPLLQLKKQAEERLMKNFKLDYVEIADTETLKIKDVWNGTTDLIALAAVFVDEVRLIDNLLIKK